LGLTSTLDALVLQDIAAAVAIHRSVAAEVRSATPFIDLPFG
jgi:hypothetical protein